MNIYQLIYKITRKLESVTSIIWEKLHLPLLKARGGRNIHISSSSIISWQNVSIGNNVYLGPNTMIISTRAQVIMKDNIMFGPNVTIITGDHRFDIPGRTMFSIKESEKLPENDLDVIINSDVWIGANVTILKGVTIGEGSIVAAGSVVIHDVPEYSIVGGIPAKVIRKRFNNEELEIHKKNITKK